MASLVSARLRFRLFGLYFILDDFLPALIFSAMWRRQLFNLISALVSSSPTERHLPIFTSNPFAEMSPACTGAIAALEKLDVQDGVMERLDGTCQLVWAPREHVQIQQIVAPNLPQDLDLFRAVEGVNKLEVLSIGHPQSWLDFFDSPGRYRITVAVHGGNRTEIVRVIVNWRGRWDDFDAA